MRRIGNRDDRAKTVLVEVTDGRPVHVEEIEKQGQVAYKSALPEGMTFVPFYKQDIYKKIVGGHSK